MNYLLDTHTFIWLDSVPRYLSAQVQAICQNSNHALYLSLASIWEMQIKLQLGKLTLPMPLDKTIVTQQETNRIQLLPIQLAHILDLAQLPHHHKDPFDRLLVAQAHLEGLTLLTNDPQIAKYGVPVVW